MEKEKGESQGWDWQGITQCPLGMLPTRQLGNVGTAFYTLPFGKNTQVWLVGTISHTLPDSLVTVLVENGDVPQGKQLPVHPSVQGHPSRRLIPLAITEDDVDLKDT